MSEEAERSAPASRRTFLRGVGLGAGASVLGAAVIAAGSPAAQASTEPASQIPVNDEPALEGSLVAHVSDIRSGRIAILVEGREIVVTDPALTRSLARKAR